MRNADAKFLDNDLPSISVRGDSHRERTAAKPGHATVPRRCHTVTQQKLSELLLASEIDRHQI